MKKVLYLIGFILFVCSCNHKKDLFNIINSSSENILIKDIVIDTFKLEYVECSFIGQSGVLEDEIYFIDHYYSYIYKFDTSGTYKGKFLGMGRGPGEIPIDRITGHTFCQDGSLVVLGNELDHWVYDSSFKFQKLIFPNDEKKTDITNDFNIYTHQYWNLICRNYESKVYFNVYSGRSNFNYFDQTNKYMEKCRHIREFDLTNEKNTRLLGGGYSNIYKSNPFKYKNFFGIIYDIDDHGNFYVNFEADSTIYKYDHDYKPIDAFGLAGNNMNQNYREMLNYDQVSIYKDDEREEKGYYSWLEYIDKTDLLFRSYKRGKHDSSDGLQIYKEGVLIGDVTVPKNLNIAGYIEPYYYSFIIIDEDLEEMSFYRFKLD